MSDALQEAGGALAAAQATIARQEAEIQRLRGQLADQRFAEELREALLLASMAGALAAPVSHSRLLEMVVETAADIINARAAALFLIDTESQELVFEVALGQRAEEVKKFRVPLGHGIAGLVAVTGQPMAISDAQRDPRHASDIAESIGYVPRSILCVPLLHDEEVIGVLELLDREGAPSFTPDDMERLGLFANLAAVAIESSSSTESLAMLVADVLASFGGSTPYRESLAQWARGFARRVEADTSYQQAIHLAQLVQGIVWQGENERRTCEAILQSFADYVRARPTGGGEWGRLQ